MLFASPKKYFTENSCWVPLFSIGTEPLTVILGANLYPVLKA